MSRFDVIAFDADDTLWHTERLYVEAQARFKDLLAQYHSPEWIDEQLYQAEMRNLPHFGYGIKAFALSMIETAVELTEGRVTGRDIQTVIDAARAMLAAEIELLEHTADVIARLARTYALMVITKGDLRDQEAKIARSGLAAHFRFVEIVSDKNPETYRALLKRHAIPPERFLMVGNSLRSDIGPVLDLGASAVYIPHPLTWAHEAGAPPPAEQSGYYELEHLGLLPGLLERLERSDSGLMNQPPTPDIHFKRITAQTVVQVCRLSDALTPPQRRMVSDNALSIAQAHFSENAWMRAIYADETPIGFVLLHTGSDYDDGIDCPGVFLWRFMIAGPFQGQGYGRQAMQRLLAHLRAQGVTELYTSCGLGEQSPEGFYQRLGFVRTGEYYGDEPELKLRLS